MIRVCKNIYRYQAREQLSRQKGYLISERADGARVVVARPPFAESWSFFIRKFDTVTSRKITDLFQDPYADYLELLCSALVQGEFTIAVTGGQGAGKTTMLAALIDYIPAQYNLRILETAFELNLRKIYPDRNILSFRETENISGQEALDLQKKTDGSVHILGEVATAPVASYMMQMASTASRFTMFTHHAKTTMMLVQELRNALLSTGTFRNEEAAINQVLSTLDIDIHLAQYQGKRFVESIQEIVPSEVSGQYHVNRLLEWREGQYHLCAPISQGKMEQLLARVPEKQKKELLMLWNEKM